MKFYTSIFLSFIPITLSPVKYATYLKIFVGDSFPLK